MGILPVCRRGILPLQCTGGTPVIHTAKPNGPLRGWPCYSISALTCAAQADAKPAKS